MALHNATYLTRKGVKNGNYYYNHYELLTCLLQYLNTYMDCSWYPDDAAEPQRREAP